MAINFRKGLTYQLAACIALHSLRLAISRVMVGTTTLVADSSTVVLDTVVTASESTTTTSWGNATSIGSRAVSCEMTDLTASVAATAIGTTNAQGWAVGLDMTESLTVVALLGFNMSTYILLLWTSLLTLGGSWHGALVGLVAWLFAVVAEPLRGSADFGIMAYIATLVACSSLDGRHVG